MRAIDLTHTYFSSPVNTSELNDMYSDSRANINFILLNIRSMRSNFNNFVGLLDSIPRFHIIALNETWLSSDEEFAYPLEGYTCFSVPRNKFGGGVLLYAMESLKPSLIENISIKTNSFESVFLKLFIGTETITVGTLYRSPSKPISVFFQEFYTLILPHLPDTNLILSGDINLDMLDSLTVSSTEFISKLSSIGLEFLITDPTRVFPTHNGDFSRSLIDHIWCSLTDVVHSFVLDYPVSDHHLPGFSFFIPKPTDSKLIESRPIPLPRMNALKCEFIESLTYFRHTHLPITQNIDAPFECLDSLVSGLIEKHVPIVRKYHKVKKLKHPWIDRDLEKLIKRKEIIHKKCTRGLLPYAIFRHFKKLLTRALKLAKQIYFASEFSIINSDSKQTWKLINKTLKPLKTESITKVKINDVTVSDPSTLCDKFNEQYISTNPSTAFPDPHLYNPDNFFDKNDHSLFLNPVTPLEVKDIILSLKNNSITSAIPIKILKFISDPLSSILCDLINSSLTLGKFPEILKFGTIKPIPKKGKSTKITDFRPITLLHPFGRIYDKLLYTRAYSFFSHFDLLSSQQFGFRANKSTEHAALNLLSDLNQANANNQTTLAVFIDLTQAFNSINHTILLSKLFQYGVHGDTLNFFESYLRSRPHVTVINNKYVSKPLISELGIAQGSSLGPLLFIIYMNDLISAITDCSLIAYADDVVIYASNHNTSILSHRIKTALDKFHDLTNINHLRINYSKTKYMVFTRHRDIHLRVRIHDTDIEQVSEFNYLGLIIDRNLSFKNHILEITRKINRVNGVLNSLKHFLPMYILRKIFFSLIFCHLNLHILSWGGTFVSYLRPLNVAVNVAIRNICRLPLSTAEKYELLRIPNVQQIYYLKLALYMFSAVVLDVNPIINTKFSEHYAVTHDYSTRNVLQFRPPRCATVVNTHFFVNHAIKLWAILPPELKTSPSLPTFKNRAKAFLSENQTIKL